MTETNFSEIKTERLLLRRLKQSDWDVICYLRSDKEVNKFVKRPGAESKEKALEFISKINSGIEDQSFYYWSITLNNHNKMIGSICLWNFSEDRKKAEIGYDLSPDHQRKGIMNESMKSVLDFGFMNLNLEIIEAYTHAQNESSKNLLARNGFILNEDRKDEHNVDNVIFERVIRSVTNE